MVDRPDWGRVGVNAPNAYEKVGDPTRWGGTTRTNIINNSFQQDATQAIQITTRDPYSRSWALLGTLTMPDSVFATAQMIASLQITMGVGQVQIMQEVALWIGTGSAGGPGGLCYQQSSLNGGPYLEQSFLAKNVAGTDIAYTTKAFAIVGGLLGQNISLRTRYGIIAGPADLPSAGIMSAIVTPFAAGQNL